MNKLLIILGPTATGKTDVALGLAKKFDGELMACDSRQVYQRLDIGTGKFPGEKLEVKKNKKYWEMNGVKIWMYDVVSLKKQYTVTDYVNEASKVVKDIEDRGMLPIIVGGTGLYLRALLDGLSNLAIPVDKKLRMELSGLGLEQLQEKLRSLSCSKWKQLNHSDRQNKRRLLRSIELLSMNPHSTSHSTLRDEPSGSDSKSSGSAYIDTRKKWTGISKYYDILKIGLTAPRNTLSTKINSRAAKWIKNGIVAEVERLIGKGVSKKRFKQLGLEYGVIIDYLNGKISQEELLKQMQTVVRQYAKRQMTWFKKEQGINWFDITENYLPEMEKFILKWYHPFDAKKD